MFGHNINDYELKAEIAVCCNQIGLVYLTEHKPTKQLLVLKKYQIDKAGEENIYIKEEILTMRQLSHPNILQFYTAFVDNLDLCVVAPLKCYGSCKDIMNRAFVTGFPEIIACLVLRDALNGIDYLHKKGFLHRSIKASHILVNKEKAVICGFRESISLLSHGERIRTLHNLPPNNIKGLNWLAPEVLEQNLLGYTEKSDVYSIGITTCELANGIEPFVDMPTTFMLTEKIRGNQPTLLDSSTCPSDELLLGQSSEGSINSENNCTLKTRQLYTQRKFTESFHKFADKCLQRFPDNRPTVCQLLSHSFFKQTKHTTLQDQLRALRLDNIDYSNSKDDVLNLSCEFGDMNIRGNFEWDF